MSFRREQLAEIKKDIPEQIIIIVKTSPKMRSTGTIQASNKIDYFLGNASNSASNSCSRFNNSYSDRRSDSVYTNKGSSSRDIQNINSCKK